MSRTFQQLRRAEWLQQNAAPAATKTAAPTVAPALDEAPSVWPELPRRSDRRAAHIHTLMSRIFLVPVTGTCHVVVFAPIDESAPKNHLAARVAEALAKHSSRPVCVVDADIARPSLHEYFGSSSSPGLVEALTGECSISEVAQQQVNSSLNVIPAGNGPGEAIRSFSPSIGPARISDLRMLFDYVLIEAPPLESSPFAARLGQVADGLVMVVEANSTRRDAAQNAKFELEQAGVRVLGAVLNNRTYPVPRALFTRI